MYNIAICDSDKNYISIIEKALCDICKDIDIMIYRYNSAEELLMDMNERAYFDLFITDTRLRSMDGNELATLLRKEYQDVVIVFYSEEEPTAEHFKVEPFRYLLKSLDLIQLVGEMQDVVQQMKRIHNEPTIIGHCRKKIVKIRIDNIIYMEKVKRGSRLIVDKEREQIDILGEIIVDYKIDELYKKFGKLGFAVPHSSFIVNMNYIERIFGSYLELSCGDSINITRKYYKEFKNRYTKHCSEKGAMWK